jgi:hypothetical protein
MNNLFEQNLVDRIILAKSEKEGKNKDRINLKLRELQDNISIIDQRKQNINDEKSYLKYIEFLKDLVENTVEQIMAPTVDDFISFINGLTNNQKDTEKLRTFLVDKYAESNLSISIDSILNHQNSLEIENSIFSVLIKAIQKDLKGKCDIFLNKTSEYSNNIDSFLDEMESTLIGISDLKELKYTSVTELFTKEQVDNSIDFYLPVINLVLEKNQSLKPIDESEKDLSNLEKIKKRITAINKCIVFLDNSSISNSKDATFQSIFLKFTEDMVKYDGGVDKNLEEFIDKKWSELETKYNTIIEFFEKKQTISYDSKWDSYPGKDDLLSTILQYNSLIKENVLANILQSKSTLAIQQTITNKSNAINDFKSYSANVRNNILQVFKTAISEYESKNLTLLDSLALSKPSITLICNEIKESLDGLKNGVTSLEKSKDIITYFAEDFLIDLNSNNDITALFRKALKESGMTDHLKWLEDKLNGSETGEISLTDLQNTILITQLLEKGLIKINIEKQF